MANIVIYHGPDCADGFTAAWAAWLNFGAEATYYPADYGQEPPEHITKDDEVWVLDFAYPRAVTEALIERAKYVTILDHHKTAAADLGDLGKFDMTKSGAVMAWERFHKDRPIPELVLYVQDRDLWQWRLSGSRQINMAIQSTPHDFAQWSALSARCDAHPRGLMSEGAAILRYQGQIVARLADRARLVILEAPGLADQAVPMVNASVCESEVGEELCRRYPGSPFSLTYQDGPSGDRVWSLRTRRVDVDVSKIAAAFGGGGHAAAAGFRTTGSSFMPPDAA